MAVMQLGQACVGWDTNYQMTGGTFSHGIILPALLTYLHLRHIMKVHAVHPCPEKRDCQLNTVHSRYCHDCHL